MAGVSKKQPLPYWQRIMDVAQWGNVMEVSRATGLPHSHIHQIFHGKIRPSNEAILTIAKAAKIPAEDIVLAAFRYWLDVQQSITDIAS